MLPRELRQLFSFDFSIIPSRNFSNNSLRHLFIQPNLAFQMLIMPLISNPNVQGWFEQHGLTSFYVITMQLLDDGIERVEEMKLLSDKKFLNLFSAEKFIVKQKQS